MYNYVLHRRITCIYDDRCFFSFLVPFLHHITIGFIIGLGVV
jgi:hypothetical protein